MSTGVLPHLFCPRETSRLTHQILTGTSDGDEGASCAGYGDARVTGTGDELRASGDRLEVGVVPVNGAAGEVGGREEASDCAAA